MKPKTWICPECHDVKLWVNGQADDDDTICDECWALAYGEAEDDDADPADSLPF